MLLMVSTLGTSAGDSWGLLKTTLILFVNG
jgi:hypothetical protein